MNATVVNWSISSFGFNQSYLMIQSFVYFWAIELEKQNLMAFQVSKKNDSSLLMNNFFIMLRNHISRIINNDTMMQIYFSRIYWMLFSFFLQVIPDFIFRLQKDYFDWRLKKNKWYIHCYSNHFVHDRIIIIYF